MCLIFDEFPTREDAEAFASEVAKTFGLRAQVFDEQDGSGWVGTERDVIALLRGEPHAGMCDLFPFKLTPPIVLVARTRDERERDVEQLAEVFSGEFAGT